ncbi:radical SAM protein [Prolixibacteraceae bacterium]|nr:radical SAM protein [Prolixibacteraceae bacterium]
MDLTLILTEKCNAKCRHCFEENCDYTADSLTMDISDAERYIDEIVAVGKQENKEVRLQFSGGEVFLVYDLMLHLTRYAKSKGIKSISCTTNGYWGKSLVDADVKVEKLVSAGITLFGISLDEFHQEYIDIDYVRNAIKTIQKYGVRIGIKTVLTKKSKRLSSVLQDIDDLLINKSIHCQSMSYIPYNSKSKIPLEDVLTEKTMPNEVCPSFVITILPNGVVFPCCSVGWTDNLILGNAQDDSLGKILKQLRSNIIFEILQDQGPIAFAKQMNLVNDCRLQEERFANYCHLCYSVFKSESLSLVLDDVITDWKRRRVDKILNILEE